MGRKQHREKVLKWAENFGEASAAHKFGLKTEDIRRWRREREFQSEVVAYVEDGNSAVDAAEKFQIPKSRVSKWVFAAEFERSLRLKADSEDRQL